MRDPGPGQARPETPGVSPRLCARAAQGPEGAGRLRQRIDEGIILLSKPGPGITPALAASYIKEDINYWEAST